MLCLTNFDFDYDLFLEEYWKMKDNEKDFARGGGSIDNFRLIRGEDMTSETCLAFTDMIKDMFSLPGKVSSRFCYLRANTSLPEHTDSDTQCAINFLLTGYDVPVLFAKKHADYKMEYRYRQALLNTQIPHMVHNGPEDRILFKVSIFDLPYHETKNLLDLKGFVQNESPIGSVAQ